MKTRASQIYEAEEVKPMLTWWLKVVTKVVTIKTKLKIRKGR